MRKMILYIAASLDSYIARKDGSIDWLKPYESGTEDYGYNDFMAGVDTLLLGKNTYTQILTFGEWPYAGKKCYVFSREPINDPRVSALADPVPAAQTMKESDGKNIWLVGGSMAVSLMVNARLVDELILTTIPIVLGSGLPLFAQVSSDIHFTLLGEKAYAGGLVQARYRFNG